MPDEMDEFLDLVGTETENRIWVCDRPFPKGPPCFALLSNDHDHAASVECRWCGRFPLQCLCGHSPICVKHSNIPCRRL
jgi:hypothetical protein